MTTTFQTDKVNTTSADITADRIADLQHLFPEAFSEGRVDFNKLRAALGDIVDDGKERYAFTWAGKSDALRALKAPSAATLIPSPEESVNWGTSNHLFIEGDNLEVLKLLYKAYFGRVKMIYIDPPYNTGNDFIYPDNFKDPLAPYLQLTGDMDESGNLTTSNPESSGRYHSAWLSMMYPRLVFARQLLRDDGVIFISIDNNEVHNLRMVLNEVFGGENFVDCVVWQKKVSPSNDAKWFSSDHDYLLVYAKSKEVWRPRRLPRTDKQKGYYRNPDNDPRGPWNSATYTCNKSKRERPNLYYPITNPNTEEEIWPRDIAVWAYSPEVHLKHAEQKRIYWGVDGTAKMPRLKHFLSEARDVVPRSIWPYADVGHTQESMREFLGFFPDGGFDTPKPTRLIKRILELSTDSNLGDLVLDFFSGSSSTAHAVLAKNREDGGNRRFITVQIPEPTDNTDFPTIADIGKERIRRVIANMQTEDPPTDRDTPEDLGLRVFKLAPSNFKPWAGTTEPTPEEFADQMDLFADPLAEGWTPESVITEMALKQGLSLTTCIKPATIAGHTVYRVTDLDKDQHFHICLDDTVSADVVTALSLTADDLFICRDVAIDDTAAANLALQCHLKTI